MPASRYTVTIEVTNGAELDVAIEALVTSDLGGMALETLTVSLSEGVLP